MAWKPRSRSAEYALGQLELSIKIFAIIIRRITNTRMITNIYSLSALDSAISILSEARQYLSYLTELRLFAAQVGWSIQKADFMTWASFDDR
jgi:hypothetical protein